MAEFAYKAKKGLYKTIEGVIEAESEDAAISKLVESGMVPIEVRANDLGRVTSETVKVSRKPFKIKLGRSRVTQKDVLAFIQKLTTLIRSGVDMLASIQMLAQQAEEGALKDVLTRVSESIREGGTFSEALEQFSHIFPPLFISIVRAGEASGKLAVALDRLHESLALQESLKRKVATSLAYPALLLCVGFASIAVLVTFVIPKLGGMMTDLGSELPLITKVILNVSGFVRSAFFWPFLLAGIVAIVIFGTQRKELLSSWIGRVGRNLPVLSRLLQNQQMALFSSSLHLLLNSGVPALQCLQIATPGVSDPRLRAQLDMVRGKVAMGEGLAASLRSETDLDPFFLQMIDVGEKSGKLSKVLEQVSKSYTTQVESDINVISALIEPVLILGLGSVLGVIILSILLPLFQITQGVR
jgi:type II secretory pathway component PulF